MMLAKDSMHALPIKPRLPEDSVVNAYFLLQRMMAYRLIINQILGRQNPHSPSKAYC